MANLRKWIVGLTFIGALWVSGIVKAQGVEENEQIYLNQVGYLPWAKKNASLPGEKWNLFHVRRTDNGQSVFSGHLKKSGLWKSSGEDLVVADFSQFQIEGEYYLEIPGKVKSSSFHISSNCYSEVLKASAKAYYFWRCSFPIEEQFGGQWHRSAGHPDTVVYVHPSAATRKRPAGTAISSPGGW